MAVMTSPAFDKVPSKAETTSYSGDAMALDGDATGLNHKIDDLFDEPDTTTVEQPVISDSEPLHLTNGDHFTESVALQPAMAPTENVSSGIDGVAQFLPEIHTGTASNADELDQNTGSKQKITEGTTSEMRQELDSGANAQPADGLMENEGSGETTQGDSVTQPQASQHHPEEAATTDAMEVTEDHADELTSTAGASTLGPSDVATYPPSELATVASSDTINGATAHLPPGPSTNPSAQSPANVDQEMVDAPSSGKIRSREEDDEEDARHAKRTKTEDSLSVQTGFKVPEVPAQPEQPQSNGIASTNGVDQSPVQSAVSSESWPTTPMTRLQNKFLLERVRNTKKIKVAYAFKEPVDPVALNIPHYKDFVKQPMDLSTMEEKLKKDQYHSVLDFMRDLDLIIDNSVTFNSREHPITQAGYNMRAYFLKGMTKMPKEGAEGTPAPKQNKQKKHPASAAPKQRRESRTSFSHAKSPTAPSVPAASPQTAWPLNAEGLPVIRRDSSTAHDRPKREIHRPPPKDLPYNSVKPKKKKYQLELKFCEGVISEMMKPKHQGFAWPFLTPVDPVALNIPQYLKIIKKPMDLGTIDRNLRQGQYQSSKEFYNDMMLVFSNCYKFNPPNDEVHKMGKMLEKLFQELWANKQDWLEKHAPASDPQSPASAYDEDEDEDEEDEEDVPEDQILAIQKQIEALNETAQALLQRKKRASPKVPGKKGAKHAKAVKPKSVPLIVPPPRQPKPKARRPAAPLSFTQKQEISDGISTLGDSDMRKAIQIIRNGCPHLADVNDEEMEIDMDELDDATLRELLKFVKTVKGPTREPVDEDFEPKLPRATGTTKHKKNKPMGKREQEESLRKIQQQLAMFENTSGSGPEPSPPVHAEESSDEEEESASESEEE
ncbi:Bromodomain-containing protein [Delitschia confertaspora ATCC 74209]|uniref:Bromodomain-containing protein n=1 Tax=Delitschia confertaspora ATCC 74209 TaxID=1513339 RepID=A0A9P4K009_9PLEO|nr:Bromodomain-containing protein [Delitschia confertaspora ATCC 74209]